MFRKSIPIAALALTVSAAIFFFYGRHEPDAHPHGFVSTNGSQFIIDGKPFRFVGANVAVMFGDEERGRMPETIRQAAQDGVRVIRVWAFGEAAGDSIVKSKSGDRDDPPGKHPFRFAPDKWNEEAFVHLDRILVEAAKNNLRVQFCLANWWRDTEGVAQYLKWAGLDDAADDKHPFGINKELAMAFYTNEAARKMYRDHVERIVLRRNSVTGVIFRDDPVIMGYELMNEAQSATGRGSERRAWVAEMSAFIKRLDPNHLIAPGTWGFRNAFERREWIEEHKISTIDYADIHNYPRDDADSFVDSLQALGEFLDNRAAAALSINKPLVIGEFGMGQDGYKGIAEDVWYRAYFENARRVGAAGAMNWVFTPAPERKYAVTYTTVRDEKIRTEIRRAAENFLAHADDRPPSSLLDPTGHLVPRQFEFGRAAGDPTTRPEITIRDDKSILYAFAPESAASGRFEKLGGGDGYIWGAGVGELEYLVPARERWQRVGKIVVRAYLQPVYPDDANGRVNSTRVTLMIDGKDCGSRLVQKGEPRNAIIQEWVVDSYSIRLSAVRGKPLSIRFVVTADADYPFGINISNWPEGFDSKGAKPVEVLVD